ncbi:MAG: ATP-binding protein [Bradyrhizobium sp.]
MRGAIEWIVKDGNRAGEVIRRVRGLLKKADTYKLPLDVNDVINEVVALLQSELNAKRVTLRLELAPAIPEVIADRVQLQQVIINLVMNGIDAMQTVKDRPHALLVRSCISETGQVVVAVSDSGIGISGDITGHVFDPFFSTKPGGLGMGLSICRSIIEDHGGRLWPTENRKEPGATFQFALPGPQYLTS